MRPTRGARRPHPPTIARATLAWLQALRQAVEAAPIARADQPQHPWTVANDALILHDEIGGRWLIRRELLVRLHADHANSAVPDEIAWFAVTNGLGGECEGYVPCYASRLDTFSGDYVRASLRGAHRPEAFDGIAGAFRMVVNDLLAGPNRSEFLDGRKDCGDLLRSMRPLRAAVAAAGGAGTEAMTLIDRVMSECPSAQRGQALSTSRRRRGAGRGRRSSRPLPPASPSTARPCD